jgi:hypothetical protein
VSRFASAFAVLCLRLAFGGPALEVARQLHEIALDPTECYRVLDLNFAREDLRVYFTSGYFIFTKPVNGIRVGAAFVTETEGGDGEVLLLPPLPSERLSLANFTESPNLDEHIRSAALLFSDATGQELLSLIQASPLNKKAPEIGALIAEKWNPVLRNLAGSFEVRMVGDLLSPERRRGLLYFAMAGAKLGNFDVLYDPRAEEQLLVGQIAYRNAGTFYDIWTSFAARSRRQAGAARRAPAASLDNFRIDATIDPDLTLKAVTRATLTVAKTDAPALVFTISRRMRVLEAKIDGRPAEVFARESLRSDLIRANGNEDFLVVPSAPLEPDKPHEIEFRHEGAVISKAGDRVYFVGARGSWYPRQGPEFSRYDLTFRYPRTLALVATGETVEDRTEGETRVTRRVASSPIRFAGFNLGDYESIHVDRGSYRIEVCANRRLEKALQLKAAPLAPGPQPRQMTQGRRMADALAQENPTPNPTGRLEELARDVAGAFEFMESQFGPPPLRSLTVSPIPGGFGQGFPGLVYLSTLAYLDPAERPAAARERFMRTFYSEVIEAHEVAHQWWGNLVVPEGYQDGWLTEALANYSALLYLEKKKGARAVNTVLDDYRNHLLAKTASGRTLESAGPITWGYRLESSQAPDAWRVITYEKGTWVLHMLRRRMGDDRFQTMLREMCRRYRFSAITTEQFRELVAGFLPADAPDRDLKGFFDTWVYGEGIPGLKLAYTVRGLRVTGTLTQTDVPEDFSALAPIEVQVGHQKTLRWVATSGEPTPFSFTLRQAPTRVALAPNDGLITVKR